MTKNIRSTFVLLVAMLMAISTLGGDVQARQGDNFQITLRGCPKGVDPMDVKNPGEVCTVPLDAPSSSGIFWGGDGQGGLPITNLPRLSSGAYVYEAQSPEMLSVDLSSLEPVVRDSYLVLGADSNDGSAYTIDLVSGETREVYVFYYNAP